MLDRSGARLQDALDRIEERAARRRTGSIALGVALGLAVVGFGIAAFVTVFTILVELVP